MNYYSKDSVDWFIHFVWKCDLNVARNENRASRREGRSNERLLWSGLKLEMSIGCLSHPSSHQYIYLLLVNLVLHQLEKGPPSAVDKITVNVFISTTWYLLFINHLHLIPPTSWRKNEWTIATGIKKLASQTCDMYRRLFCRPFCGRKVGRKTMVGKWKNKQEKAQGKY